MSVDGGASWSKALNVSGHPITYGGLDVSYGDPTAPSAVGFASNWRTADGGATWAEMAGVSGVITHDLDPAIAPGAPVRLFGLHNSASASSQVVVSSDHGATWTTLLTLPVGSGSDLAFDYASNALYAVASDSLYKCTASSSGSLRTRGGATWSCVSLDATLPKDQHNSTRVTSVAVDPQQPGIVYIAQKKDIYAANNAVARSTDGGVTWTNMLLQAPLSLDPAGPLQGPHEVSWVRVHPTTREVWAAGECFGIWKAPPPPTTA